MFLLFRILDINFLGFIRVLFLLDWTNAYLNLILRFFRVH